jgi:hypothetical protein
MIFTSKIELLTCNADQSQPRTDLHSVTNPKPTRVKRRFAVEKRHELGRRTEVAVEWVL